MSGDELRSPRGSEYLEEEEEGGREEALEGEERG